MADYIDREALLFDLKTSFVPQSTTYTDAVGIAIRWIKQAPVADVAPVVHGRWEHGDMYDFGDVCPVCGWDSGCEPCSFNYCPNCGANMMDLKEEN